MPKIKFNEIYKDLKSKIENEEYEYQQMLPSENTLVEIYHCSATPSAGRWRFWRKKAAYSPCTARACGSSTSRWMPPAF